jgi:hypothetical protein
MPPLRRPGGLLLALSLSLALPAQAQLLRGTVVDDASGRGVAAAALVLTGAAGDTLATTATDSAGLFLLRLPGTGRFLLQASHLGFAPSTVELPPAGPGEELRVRVSLGRSAVPMAPIMVLGRRSFNPALMDGYYRRAAAARPRNDGRILLREDLERMTVSQASEYLRSVPSLQLRPAPLGEGRGSYPVLRRMGTLCEPAVYLNGNRIAGQNIDSFVRPGTLEGIEVYTRGDEPPEYWDRADCGVILIWNRSDTDGARISWGRGARLAAVMAGVAAVFAAVR